MRNSTDSMGLLSGSSVRGLAKKFGSSVLLGAVMASPMAMSSEAMGVGYTWRYDTITVQGGEFGNTFDGVYDIEGEYLPGVVDCENGNANVEALKAQAVAARTFAYFKIMTAGKIENGQGDQVFRTPGNQTVAQKHIDAVNATAGEILTFNGKYIASFYVAGSKPDTLPMGPGDSTPIAFWRNYPTEKYVTYNYPKDKWGNDNQHSTLGSAYNEANRGCMSQNGADYLAYEGMNYIDILKYYYGGDIQVESVMTSPWSDQSGFASRKLADFESEGWKSNASREGIFGYTPKFSGSNRNIGTNTTAEIYKMAWDATSDPFVHSGKASQKIVIDYDESKPNAGTDGFFLRHVAGVQNVKTNMVASKTSNALLEAMGSVGVWLKTSSSDLKVSIAVDDNSDGVNPNVATGDRGVKFDVIADGEWHKYEWFLEDADYWEAWTGSGNGEIGKRFSLDSIQFWGNADAELYMDDVFYDMKAVAVPIPEPTSLLVFGGLAGLMLRRRR